MYEIIKLLFDICLFKKGPHDLPYSLLLQKLLIIAYASIRLLMLHSFTDWIYGSLQITVEIIFIGGFGWIMLYFDRRLLRFCQVTSAFYGTFALLGFCTLPAIASMAIGRGGLLVFLVMIVLTGWFCAVTAHIIYHALERQLSKSTAVSFLFLMGSYLMLDFLSANLSGIT